MSTVEVFIRVELATDHPLVTEQLSTQSDDDWPPTASHHIALHLPTIQTVTKNDKNKV